MVWRHTELINIESLCFGLFVGWVVLVGRSKVLGWSGSGCKSLIRSGTLPRTFRARDGCGEIYLARFSVLEWATAELREFN